MTFNLTNKCRTSGYFNNCGLNCLTHFFISKLKTGELQTRYANHPQYKKLLKTFKEYYGISKTLNWEQLNQLFAQKYLHPIEQEFVFGPVLRKHFVKVLMEPSLIEAQWEGVVAGAISQWLTHEEIEDAANPVAHSNPDWFENLGDEFDTAIAAAMNGTINPITKAERAFARSLLKDGKRPINAKSIAEQVAFTRENQEQDKIIAKAKAYWKSTGCLKYANYMADINVAEMVSADQLLLMAQTLDVHLEVYNTTSLPDPFLKDPRPMAENAWVFKVGNFTGDHWEYEEPNGNTELVQCHNRVYDDAETITIVHDDIQAWFKSQQSHKQQDSEFKAITFLATLKKTKNAEPDKFELTECYEVGGYRLRKRKV